MDTIITPGTKVKILSYEGDLFTKAFYGEVTQFFRCNVFEKGELSSYYYKYVVRYDNTEDTNCFLASDLEIVDGE